MDKEVEMDEKEYLKEHKHLDKVLRKGSKSELLKEAEKQKKEVKGHKAEEDDEDDDKENKKESLAKKINKIIK